MSYYQKKTRIGRTTNRTLGFLTPTPSDELCPYFHHRFIRHGVALPENRAICDKEDLGLLCDYYKNVNGIPFCMRYWYGPKYELTDLIRTPFVQKKTDTGALLFYEIDGVTETTAYTAHPVLIPIYDARPLKYGRDDWEKEQRMEWLPDPITGKEELLPAFWEYTQFEPKLVAHDTGYPAYKWGNMEFYSMQYEDTHEKRFFSNGGQLGWHKDV